MRGVDAAEVGFDEVRIALRRPVRRAVGQAETNWRLNVRLPAQVGG